MAIVFKTDRVRGEWTKLHHYNPALCKIVHELSAYLAKQQQNLTITCIYRSQKENNEIYRASKPKHQKVTAHTYYTAVDIRSHGLEAFIPEMLELLNAHNSRNANRTRSGQTAIFHEVNGHGPHFHIQFQEKHAHKLPKHANHS
ncbi:hypothetical protein [Paraburkholderia pallida]|uniref:Uncharacterized protein n=1 Tax=Paraburkholderia pallida TaxID=2547399 RepID=A0A4P7D2F9_9BURK|nr:hypothetical protein [Paraburkholderia pallida]QBR02961.1 hypothetical protein E1956_37845 [Paraburkholderia pallida]